MNGLLLDYRSKVCWSVMDLACLVTIETHSPPKHQGCKHRIQLMAVEAGESGLAFMILEGTNT